MCFVRCAVCEGSVAFLSKNKKKASVRKIASTAGVSVEAAEADANASAAADDDDGDDDDDNMDNNDDNDDDT